MVFWTSTMGLFLVLGASLLSLVSRKRLLCRVFGFGAFLFDCIAAFPS